MRPSSGQHEPTSGPEPVSTHSNLSLRTHKTPSRFYRNYGNSTPQSPRFPNNKSRGNSRRPSFSSSVRSAGHSQVLSDIPTVGIDSGPATVLGTPRLKHLPGEATRYSLPQPSTWTNSDISDGNTFNSRSTTINAPTTDTAPTEVSDATFSDIQKTPVEERNIDETINTVVKLPDEFLRRSRELIIQNPTPGSGGWFMSPQNGFQYVLVMHHGKPFMWDRQTNEQRALDEMFTFANGFSTPALNTPRARSERLDPGYITRTSGFFTVGKVFSILFTEPCNDSAKNRRSHNVSTVTFGEKVFSQITRFVVVQQGKGFCYACPILTYGGRGTLKHGCNPVEHAIAYMQGSQPNLLSGERGIVKSPIEIVPTDVTQNLDKASRIRFGRGQVIQHNTKAKDIGNVADHHLSQLIAYWREEMCEDFGYEWVERSKALDETPNSTTRADKEEFKKNVMQACDETISNGTSKQSNTGPRRDTVQIHGIEYVIISEVGGQLHSGFESVQKPRKFFKKGRSFMVFWPELAGTPETERTIYWKIRRFVVIRAKAAYCLCLSISTYQGQGTTKVGVSIQDHAPVVPVDGEVKFHPEEQELIKSPLYIKTEDASISIDSMSRINFAKVYTVEYNLKVRNVGRIISDSIRKMEEYFVEAVKLAT